MVIFEYKITSLITNRQYLSRKFQYPFDVVLKTAKKVVRRSSWRPERLTLSYAFMGAEDFESLTGGPRADRCWIRGRIRKPSP